MSVVQLACGTAILSALLVSFWIGRALRDKDPEARVSTNGLVISLAVVLAVYLVLAGSDMAGGRPASVLEFFQLFGETFSSLGVELLGALLVLGVLTHWRSTSPDDTKREEQAEQMLARLEHIEHLLEELAARQQTLADITTSSDDGVTSGRTVLPDSTREPEQRNP